MFYLLKKRASEYSLKPQVFSLWLLVMTLVVWPLFCDSVGLTRDDKIKGKNRQFPKNAVHAVAWSRANLGGHT